MLDGERDMDTCTCVGMHTHAFMGSLPQTDGRLHRRTTVYDASRPGTVCGSLQGCVRACTCVPRHRLFLIPVRCCLSAAHRPIVHRPSFDSAPVSVDEPGYAFIFRRVQSRGMGIYSWSMAGAGAARVATEKPQQYTALRWYR